MNRFLEIYDKNNQPIFEGDECTLSVLDHPFGSSYFGDFIRKFEVDNLRILFNKTGQELKHSITISFFKNSKQIITNREHCESEQIEDTSYYEENGYDNFFELTVDDWLFIKYIVDGRIIKENKDSNIESVRVKDEDLKIIVEDSTYSLTDHLLFPATEEIKNALKNHINNSKGDFTHVSVQFKRRERFRLDTTFCLTDDKGNPTVLVIDELKDEVVLEINKIKQEIKNVKVEYENLIYRAKEGNDNDYSETGKIAHLKKIRREKIKELKNRILELEDSDDNYEYTPETDFFVGINQDEKFLKWLQSESEAIFL